MPKKVTKTRNIAVESKKQGYWVNKENLRKGERTIKAESGKALVKRNRAGYEYDKTITGFEWTKAELLKELAKRAEKGLIEQQSIARDLAHTHRITKTAPIITAEEFFSRDEWFKRDVLGVDTPPGMTLEEIQEVYKEEKKEPKKTKPTKTYPYGAILQLERSGVDLSHLYYLMHTGRLRHDVEIMRILGANKMSDVFMLIRDYNQFERNRLEELKTTKQLKDKNYLNQEQINQAKEIKELLETKETLYKDYQKPKPLQKQAVKAKLDDIDRETANRAFSNTSWSPERRGESARKSYVSHLNEFFNELYAKVPPEQHTELNQALAYYKEKYKSKTLEQLHRHTSLASSAVTGRSNFPVASQRRKGDVYQRKQIEFSEWDTKVQNKIRRDFGLAGGKGISSDDPEVIQKIDVKIRKLESNQQRMKDANKIVRNKNLSKEEKAKNLKNIGFDTQSTHDLLKEDFAGRDGYPSYMLSNNSANIRRLKQRKETLQQQKQQITTAKRFDGVRIEDNVEANRLRIYFDEKPPDKIISELKSNGFRWTPSIGAWQRYRSERAEHLAKEIVEDYNKKKEPVKKAVDRSKSIAAGKNLYLEKYDPNKTHLALTKTMTDMQKRRLIKMCKDNNIDTRELDPSLKYDENQEIIDHRIELNEEQMRDARAKVDQKIQHLEGTYYGGFSKKRIKERALDEKTTEPTVITEEDLIRKRKKKKLEEWEDEPYLSKIDVEDIDTKKTKSKEEPIERKYKEYIHQRKELERKLDETEKKLYYTIKQSDEDFLDAYGRSRTAQEKTKQQLRSLQKQKRDLLEQKERMRFKPSSKYLTEEEIDYIKNHAKKKKVRYEPARNVILEENLRRINIKADGKTYKNNTIVYSPLEETVYFDGFETYNETSEQFKEKLREVAYWDGEDKVWRSKKGKKQETEELIESTFG